MQYVQAPLIAMSLAAWVTQVQTPKQCFKLLLSSFALCFCRECAWRGILNTQNCKDVRMSVDACGSKLKSFQVAKAHQKKTNKHIKKFWKNLKEYRDDSLVKNVYVWGQGRDGTCSRTTSCLIVHKSHHTYVCKYPYMWGFEIDKWVLWLWDSKCSQTDLLIINTPHVGICGCDL